MLFSEPKIPQSGAANDCTTSVGGFSALQRAENSSILECRRRQTKNLHVSVLFSEPKIPQSDAPGREERSPGKFQCSSASRKFLNQHPLVDAPERADVSVLFSEPKIPQWCTRVRKHWMKRRFSALQRAENSSMPRAAQIEAALDAFQCSSASRKFLNPQPRPRAARRDGVSVLFSEPKIPQL